MPSCVLRYCTNNSSNTAKCKGITFHKFPRLGRGDKEKWIKFVRKNRSEEIWLPSAYSCVCSLHFREEDKFYSKTGRRYLKKSAVPCIDVPQQYSQPSTSTSQTSPWHNSDSDSNSRNQEERDPLSCRIEQCCFCGEFSKECIAISNHMPYVDSGKTILSLNCMSVQLNFNDTLMNTVCKDCDAKLQELCDFVQQVKNAQEILINLDEAETAQETLANVDVVKMAQETQINVNTENTELLVIKTESECEVSDNENESTEIEKEESLVRTLRHPLNNISRVEDKTGGSLIRTIPSKTVKYKKKSDKTDPPSKFSFTVETASVTRKRKSDKIETANEQKKLKVITDRNKGSVEDTIEVKEEPVDEDEINSDISDVSKLVAENNKSELENAKYIVLKTVENGTLMVCEKKFR